MANGNFLVKIHHFRLTWHKHLWLITSSQTETTDELFPLVQDTIVWQKELQSLKYLWWKVLWYVANLFDMSKVLLAQEECVSTENVASEDKCHLAFVPLPNNTWASGDWECQKLYNFLSPSFQTGAFRYICHWHLFFLLENIYMNSICAGGF